MAPSIEVEVEDNENSYGVPLRVYSSKGEPYRVSQVKMDTMAGIGVLHWITGWSHEGGGTPCPAYCVPVEDSGAALSYLVYGGDWGVRFKPVGLDQDWSIDGSDQFGEPYLLLGDESDIVAAAPEKPS